MSKSTTVVGNELRDHVARYLKAANKTNLTINEKLLAGKKADIYYEEKGSFRTTKVAVECKNEAVTMSNSTASAIYSDYLPALNSRLVDEVVIINRHGLSPQAQEVFGHDSRFLHLTDRDFIRGLMNFDQYLHGLITDFESDGLHQYYIPPTVLADDPTFAGKMLEEYVDEWVQSDSAKPIAVLAGYGMGKSCFSRFIAKKYAQYATEGKGRIPILIKLGGLSHEQSASGLIASALTAQDITVDRFTYSLFERLNEGGQLLLILDGFDEMKHTMSATDFMATMRHFANFVTPQSKVLLLGRPNAFMSDDERRSALHGIDRIAQEELRDSRMADFTEVGVATFTATQTLTFFQSYLAYIMPRTSARRGITYDRDFISNRLKQLSSPHLMELAARPVHARMLSVIAAEPTSEISDFSRHTLYSLFIKQFFEREYEKGARIHIPLEKRLHFTKSLAWHFWAEKSRDGFTLTEVPKSLVGESGIPHEAEDCEAILRDLLSGTIIDVKDGDRFYFPHRSFHEFLVAESIRSRNWIGSDLDPLTLKVLTPEIVDFLSESNDTAFLNCVVCALQTYEGNISTLFLELLCRFDSYDGLFEDSKFISDNPWMHLVIGNRLKSTQMLSNSVLMAISYERASSINNPVQRYALFFLALFFLSRREDEREAASRFAARIIGDNLAFMEELLSSAQQRYAGDEKGLSLSRLLLLSCLSNDADSRAEVKLALHAGKVLDVLRSYKGGGIVESVYLAKDPLHLTIQDLAKYNPALKMTERGNLVVKFFKRFPSLDRITHVKEPKKIERKKLSLPQKSN